MILQVRRLVQVLAAAVTTPWVVQMVVNSGHRKDSNVMSAVVWMLKLTSTNDWFPPKTFAYRPKLSSIQITTRWDTPVEFMHSGQRITSNRQAR